MKNDMFMMVLFLVIWIYQIMLLIKAYGMKHNERWILLSVFEVAACIFARVLINYYDSLDGAGFMPGMTYFPHAILSIGALFLYLIMLVITLVSWLVISIIKRKNSK